MKRNNSIFREYLENEQKCLITKEPFQDPVVAMDGYTYERKAILEWFEKNWTSPKTNQSLALKVIIPNHSFKNMITGLPRFLIRYDCQREQMQRQIQQLQEKERKLENICQELILKYSNQIDQLKEDYLKMLFQKQIQIQQIKLHQQDKNQRNQKQISQLVDRVMELENQLLLLNSSEYKKNRNQFQSLNNSSTFSISVNFNPATAAGLSLSKQSQFRQKILIKQQQIEKLMKENIFLQEELQSINSQLREEKKFNHEVDQMQMNRVNKDREGSEFSPILVPSFQTLLLFLKNLPSQKGQYHAILLRLIEGYQKKVAQFREENAFLRTKHKQIQQYLIQTIKLLQKIDKNLISTSKRNPSSSIKSTNYSQKLFLLQQKRIERQIKSLLTRYQRFLKLSQNQKSQQFFITNQKQKLMSLKSISKNQKFKPASSFNQQSQLNTKQQQILLQYQLQLQLTSRITYHLMFLRSLTYGIGRQDLQLIQQQLNDYLEQVKKRMPIVLQRQQFEEDNMSSYNVSFVDDNQLQNQV